MTASGSAGQAPTVPTPTAPTVGSAHQALVSVALIVGVLMLMVLLAGVSQAVGRAEAGILFAFLALRSITHADPLVTWVSGHQSLFSGGTS